MIEMRISPPTKNRLSREHIISELKSDFRYALFFLLPKLRPAAASWQEIARELRLPEDLAEEFAQGLFSAGLWQLEDGKIQVRREHLDLGDLKISEFLSMSVSLLARMHEEGPCWYETLFVTTNETLKKEFYAKVNRALKELVTASNSINGDLVLAWNHSGLDCLKAIKEGEE